jgi:predicted enzyme related to lactoylglutathione lyase
MGHLGVYQLFSAGGDAIGGMMTKMPECPAPFWLYYFNVDNINAAIDRVKENNGQVLMGPQEVPGGSWIMQGFDPQGAMFALVGPSN